MITDKIKALFQFIEYLHSNIENFKQYDEVINELHLLNKERNELNPQKNFTDKLKYDKVRAEINDKFKVIQENIIQVIQAKANELNICDLNKTETLWNWNSSEIFSLEENFSTDDIPEILQHKSKYLEFRTKTNCDYFLTFFFQDLDRTLRELFDFFKETTENEFETFETKTIQVNSIREVVEQFEKGHKKFTLPIDILNPSKVQQKNIEPSTPQQSERKGDQPEPDLQEPTAPVKALFIYYLSQSKVIHFPQKGVFEVLMSTYHFEGSVMHVYNLFRKLDRGKSEIMNMKNLKSVIELLNPYPTALRKAENDLYQIERESREAPADFS